ncbi:major facilitator superfamily domain-containing protein [Dactylonectria macrodidyma]|uniref:Major facilitator superfamily domain-containing protein n=1 Tax=Dactylonectria macrodidyma TaxID=307937 RepID=A0A9P9FQB7_9HYPO|nr:major facilitator superfamily domain-containing protein [Dactylonectria macrodidyma]
MADIDHRDSSSALAEDQQPPQTGLFKFVSRFFPYFRNPHNVLLFKLDCLLLTWAFLAGIMKEMDQSATTQAYVSGMRESLSLYGNELVKFTTFFSAGYAVGLVPGQLIQTKIRPSLFLPFCEITWGLLVLFTYKAPNAETIYGLRFFLGLFSAVFWPSVVSLIFNWYTPTELAVRIAFFTVSDVAGAMFLGALQAALYTNMNGVYGLAGWQWLFIISGAITVGQGLIGFVIIPDSPAYTRAIWLTDAEKVMARKRMNEFGANTSQLIPASVLKKKLRKLIVHPVTYFFLFAFAFSAWAHRANAYFVLFLESLTDSDGNQRYSTYQINVIPLGGYALQILTNLVLNWLSDWKHWRWQISIGSAFCYGIMLSVLCGWPSDWKVVLGFYFLTYATNAGSPSFMAWMAELLRKEPEARAIIVALTVTIVYIGHATMPLRTFRVADSPRYPVGFPVSTAFIFASIAIQFGMLWWGRRNPQLVEYGYDAPTNMPRVLDEESSKVDEKESPIDSKTPQTKVSKVDDE